MLGSTPRWCSALCTLLQYICICRMGCPLLGSSTYWYMALPPVQHTGSGSITNTAINRYQLPKSPLYLLLSLFYTRVFLFSIYLRLSLLYIHLSLSLSLTLPLAALGFAIIFCAVSPVAWHYDAKPTGSAPRKSFASDAETKPTIVDTTQKQWTKSVISSIRFCSTAGWVTIK